jgi:hypothetical protein
VGKRKIVDEAEVLRWFEEGRTYAWMQAEYLRKYDVDTVSSMWSNFRHRKGLDRRIERNDDLIPWAVERAHRWAYPLQMLRAEARRRAGMENPAPVQDRLNGWLANMRRDNTVVEYDPSSEDGFSYVPRGFADADLIRVPESKTTTRRSADRVRIVD